MKPTVFILELVVELGGVPAYITLLDRERCCSKSLVKLFFMQTIA